MALISEVVDAMTRAQEAGLKVLSFVIPVNPDALAKSRMSAHTIEDRVQQVMIAELRTCLGPETGEEEPITALEEFELTLEALEIIVLSLTHTRDLHTGAASVKHRKLDELITQITEEIKQRMTV